MSTDPHDYIEDEDLPEDEWTGIHDNLQAIWIEKETM